MLGRQVFLANDRRLHFLCIQRSSRCVKDIDLPGSLHTTTNARRYEVAAGVAKTVTGIRWMQTASPAAPLLQLRLDPKTGSHRARPGALGPWGPWARRRQQAGSPRPSKIGGHKKLKNSSLRKLVEGSRLSPCGRQLLQSAIASGRT